MSRFAAIAQPRTVQTPEGAMLAGDAIQAASGQRGNASPVATDGAEMPLRSARLLNLLQVLEALRQTDVDLVR